MNDPLRPDMARVKPPANLPALYRRINGYAGANGLPAARVQQRVTTELLFALLENARKQDIIPMYVAKGGMAIELRFGVRARASGDLDVGIVAEDADLLPAFDEVLALGLGDFTFVRGQTQFLANASAHQTDRGSEKVLKRSSIRKVARAEYFCRRYDNCFIAVMRHKEANAVRTRRLPTFD